jgi:glycerol-3-phosphate acyltransferase PlsY
MAGMIAAWVSLLLAYAAGCLSFAAMAARLRGVDIRAHGSGNPGATNVGRVLGPAWGRAVLLLDIAKGAVPALLLEAPPEALGLPALPGWLVDGEGRVLVAAAAVVGHVFPVTSGFRGGKGVATLVGALVALDPALAVLAGLIHLAVKRLAGFVSVASVVMVWSFPLAQVGARWLPDRAGRFVDGTVVLVLLALLVTSRHLDNFRRIRAGVEDRYDDRDREAMTGNA